MRCLHGRKVWLVWHMEKMFELVCIPKFRRNGGEIKTDSTPSAS
ncbi:hypothetical protein C943_03838 [Mariniradius saccharolyticus AK6]|uniref:Uncharacterized protein n=1 Tax=Mariniradius saccharolyticus AK6 TaxID=1239962 RepID=M7XZU0_9BACT|nr:hypothetical protein C943_03838 [Mariniradius saccharolyticus AK6]